MKKTFCIFFSCMLAFSMVSISAMALIPVGEISTDDTICLTKGYAEKEAALVNAMTRMAEINLLLHAEQRGTDSMNILSADARADLYQEYQALESSIRSYKMTVQELSNTIYSDISNPGDSMLAQPDYPIGDVTHAFDLLMNHYNIYTLSGTWARGGIIYDTFCIMVIDAVGGTNLYYGPQNVTLCSGKSQTGGSMTAYLSWTFETFASLVKQIFVWWASSAHSFSVPPLESYLNLGMVKHADQLTVTSNSVMRYTYVKPQNGTIWVHANTSHRLVVLENHLTNYIEYMPGQNIPRSECKSLTKYFDGRFYFSDMDGIDNYRRYNHPGAIVPSNFMIQTTYYGKGGNVTITHKYYRKPFQLMYEI